MASLTNNALFSSDLWERALESFASAAHLTVKLFDADARVVFGPIHPTPLFQLFEATTGYDPGLFAECARRCLAQTNGRPAVMVSEFCGLSVVGTSLALDGKIVGAAVGGYAFVDFSQLSEVQRLAQNSGISFERLWRVALEQKPVPQQRLVLNGELLQVLGDALLRENYRTRQYEDTVRILQETVREKDEAHQKLEQAAKELARQQECLFQAQKMESIGILAGGIAHDFNNILTGVLGNASLALDSIPAGSPNRVLLQGVIQASERAAHLTRQLLAYAGKGRFVIEALDLSQRVREISALVQTSIPSAVQLRFDLAERLPCIDGDVAQIQQIIMNLVINGAEAIPQGQPGTVIVTTGVQEVDEEYLGKTLLDMPIAPGTYVTLEVQDTGIGMDQETQSRIFDPFFTTKFTGRGLGLSAVMGIVRGHHGALKIYSTPGCGSTFKVLLPASESSPLEQAKPQVDERLLAGRGTVMVIDDESIVRKVAKTTLERFGYSVIVCDDGPTAITLFGTMAAEVSVILLDMSMPKMSGEETFRHLRAIRQDVKVILSSGYSEVEAFSHFNGNGLAGFIQKPYTSARLGEKVRSVLQVQCAQTIGATQ